MANPASATIASSLAGDLCGSSIGWFYSKIHQFNLESSVGQGIGCFCGGQKMVLGQGVTVRNGHSLSSSYNAAMRRHRSAHEKLALDPVASFTHRVKVGNTVFLLLFIYLLKSHSGQLRILGSSALNKYVGQSSSWELEIYHRSRFRNCIACARCNCCI